MKKTFQWLSALTLMVVSALAFVACGDDDDNGNGGGAPDNSKIVGTWVVQQVSPNDGPRVNSEMTFGSNGSFVMGDKQGTYTYDSRNGAFTANVDGMAISGTMKVNGNVAQGSVNVVTNGRTKVYTMTMAKKGSEEEEPAAESRMVGDWDIELFGAGSYIVGSTISFTEEGTWTLEDGSGTYTAETDGKGRIVFNLYRNGSQIWTGKVVPVSGGNVLTGEVREVNGSGVGDYQQFLLKKPGYVYPSNGTILGRWMMTACNIDGAPIGSVLVFENNGELYIEGDPHVGSYTVTNTVRDGKVNSDVEMHLGNGPTIVGTVVIENTYASMTNGTATMGGETMQGVSVTLSKPGTK